jgi:hypothetical protein
LASRIGSAACGGEEALNRNLSTQHAQGNDRGQGEEPSEQAITENLSELLHGAK